MRNFKINKTALAFTLALAVSILAFASPATAQGRYRGNGPGLGTVVTTQPVTTDETRWLIFMREEEKLAHDVYEQLGGKWNLSVFRNILASEQRHFDSLGTLLARYSVPDPAKNLKAGVYSDSRLSGLYNELMAKGMRSVKDALEVGLAVEKRDIDDLELSMKTAEKLDIKRVYTNLLNGSYNHQEAFETTLEVLNPVAPAN